MKQGVIGSIFLGMFFLTSCGQLELGIETPTKPTDLATTIMQQDDPTSTITPEATNLKPPAVITAVPANTQTPSPTNTATPTLSSTPSPIPIVNTPIRPSATPIPPPEINAFTVEPQTVEPESTIEVGWDVFGDMVELCFVHEDFRECLETAVSDTITWQLPTHLRQEFNVELSVTNGEQTAAQQQLIIVTCAANANWWFFDLAPTNCPQAEAITTQAASQAFENGSMLWLGHEDVIFVLFDDGTMTQFDGNQLLGDTETGDGGVSPPQGFVAPIRGFGLVWRGETEGTTTTWIQDKMGWGLSPELGFETQFQEDMNGGIYVQDANGQLIYLLPASASWVVYREANE